MALPPRLFMEKERKRMKKTGGTGHEARNGRGTRLGLIICFLLGAALALAGVQGQRELTASGFGSEAGACRASVRGYPERCLHDGV